MEQIQCQLEGYIFRNADNGYTVAEFSLENDLFTAVGILPELSEGSWVQLTGEWKEHPSYGQQFSISLCEPILPRSRDALIRYLSSGLIYGVGESTARRIVDTLGEEALDIIRYSPERLTEVPGIGPTRAQQIRDSLDEHLAMQEVMIFLQSLEIGNAMAAKIFKAYGDKAELYIRRDPYRMVQEIDGIGFRTADLIARRLGVQETAPSRSRAAIHYLLRESAAQNGHMYLPRESLLDAAQKLLSCERELLEDCLVSMMKERALVYEEMEEVPCLYLPAMYAAETECAYLVSRLAGVERPCLLCGQREIREIAEAFNRIELSAEQVDAVTAAVSGQVTLITGGPGTGKTTVLDCLLTVLEQCGLKTELAAPTGRAAKRMAQACGRTARTLHRLLEYNYSPDETELVFQRDAQHPLECDAVVVDEMSMVDIYLFQHLLEAIRPGTRLILIGDVDQLPSVGPGRVLRDLMESGTITVCRLTQVFRQAMESRIIVNAHRVNAGEMPLLSGGKDFFFERQNSAADVAESLKNMIASRIPGYLSCDPLQDIQVLAPMKKGPLGVQQLNEALQAVFNPPAPGKAECRIGGVIMREGDKIIQNRNDYDIEWESRDPMVVPASGKGIFNGDIGFIRKINTAERRILLEFEDSRYCEMDFPQAEHLTHAYAISIHKSQGSEFPVVLLPLLSGPPMLMTRNLLYTALTRAKKMAVILGSRYAIERMVENNWVARRYSGLKRRLQEAFREVTSED